MTLMSVNPGIELPARWWRGKRILRGWLTTIVIVFAVGCASDSKTARGSARGGRPVRVIVVAGQSNAVGYNHVRDYHGGREPFPDTLKTQPRVIFWPGKEPAPPVGSDLWTSLRVGESGAFGPEISLAHDLEQAWPEAQIAIVKFAVGGSGIARSTDYSDYIPALANYDDHGRNWHWPSADQDAGILYQGLISNVRAALSALEREGRKWELTGFVWMQGEHEGGISRKMAGDYAALLAGFMKTIRKDLHSPTLPFAIGQVNSHTWAYGDIARQCQTEVCAQDNRTRLVKTVDLPRVSGDAAHFTADGMLTLGSRFAEAMVALVK